MKQKVAASVTSARRNKSIKLGSNLKELMQSRHINITRLSRDLKIPMMTIRRLLSGETADPRISTLKLIADYFKVSLIDLIENNASQSMQISYKSKPHLVPILNWETAAKISKLTDLDLTHWKNWQPVYVNDQCKIGEKAYALESKPSMHPRFPQGTIFIIDPEVSASDGDIVLVKIKQSKELTLRELTVDSPEWKLHPIVPSASNIIHYNHREHQIVGVNLITLFFNPKLYS